MYSTIAQGESDMYMAVSPNTPHRIVVTVDIAMAELQIYVDGESRRPIPHHDEHLYGEFSPFVLYDHIDISRWGHGCGKIEHFGLLFFIIDILH